MAGSVKVGGAWKTVSGASVKVGGAWKTVSAGYTKVGGAWKQWYSSGSYFFGVFNAGSAYEGLGNSVTSDSSGNIYWGTQENGIPYLHKIDSNGNLLQQRTFVGSQAAPRRLNVDSSSNLYFGAKTASGQASFKVNSNLDVVWKKYIAVTASTYESAQVLTTGEVASTSTSNNSSYVNFKNSAGAFVRQRRYAIDDNYSSGKTKGLVAGPSGTVIQGAISWVGGATPYPSVFKWNNDGSLAWHRKSSTAEENNYFSMEALSCDASGNVHILTQVSGGTGGVGYLSKFDTNGTLQWSVGMSGGVTAKAVSVDTNGDAYIYATWQPNGSYLSAAILKFNSAGTLQWQRDLRWGGASRLVASDIHVNGSSFIVTTQTQQGTPKSAIARLPKDGTKTGTYTVAGVSVVYGASTITIGGGVGWNTGSGATSSETVTVSDDPTTYSTTSTAISKVVI